jgi:hypothetical protein
VTDPRLVADALSRLADGTAPNSLDYRRVVADAAAAVADVRAAATFVSAGGHARLRVATLTADRAGDDEIAARGRRALDALEEVRTAARSGDGDDVASVPLRSRNDFTCPRSTTGRRR